MSFPDSLTPRKRSLLDGLNDSIRENPIGAGVIGMGVLWMLLGRRRVASIGGAIPGAIGTAATSVGSAAAAGGHAVSSGFNAAGARIREASGKVTDAISQPFASAGAKPTHEAEPTRLDAADIDEGSLGASMSDGVNVVREKARSYAHSGMKYGTSLKDQLGDSFERQPLLLGALGVAIGAGIAAAFPSTRVESEFLGAQSLATREKIQEAADDLKSYATSTAKQVLEDVKQEAEMQGLTAGAAKEALQDVATKAKNVASSAKDSLTNRV